MMKLVIVAAGILFMSGCYYHKEELLYPDSLNCTTTPARFSTDIAPLIQSRCAISGCHAAGSTNGPGPLTSYTLIKNAAPEIKAAVVSRFMPKTGTLSQLEIKKISCWVDAGAPEN
jgi:hypothetical protein